MSNTSPIPEGWEQYKTQQPQTPSMAFGALGNCIRGTYVKVEETIQKDDDGSERKVKLHYIKVKEGYYHKIDSVSKQVSSEYTLLPVGEVYILWGKPMIDKEFDTYKIGDNVGAAFTEWGKPQPGKNTAKIITCFNFGRDEEWHRSQSNPQFQQPAAGTVPSTPGVNMAPAGPVQPQPAAPQSEATPF